MPGLILEPGQMPHAGQPDRAGEIPKTHLPAFGENPYRRGKFEFGGRPWTRCRCLGIKGREFKSRRPAISGKEARRFVLRLVVERWRRDDLFVRLFDNRFGFRLPGTLDPVLPAGLPNPLCNVVP